MGNEDKLNWDRNTVSVRPGRISGVVKRQLFGNGSRRFTTCVHQRRSFRRKSKLSARRDWEYICNLKINSFNLEGACFAQLKQVILPSTECTLTVLFINRLVSEILVRSFVIISGFMPKPLLIFLMKCFHNQT